MDLFDIAVAKALSGSGGGGGEPVIEALSVTENGTYTAPSGVDGYSPVTVNVSGGGGGLSLVTTQSLGHIEYSSTSWSNLPDKLYINADDAAPYDVLIICICADEALNGYHLANTTAAYLYNNQNIENEKALSVISSDVTLIHIVNSSGVVASRTMMLGICPYTAVTSSGRYEITLRVKYSSTSTLTINNNYTAYVYGMNVFDSIINK